MALSLLTKPSPTRALLIVRLHHASPAAMGVARLSVGPVELRKSLSLPQVGPLSLRFCSSNGVAELNISCSRASIRRQPMCFHVPLLRTVDFAAGDGNPLLRKPSSVQGLGFSSTQRASVCRHSWIPHSGGAKHQCFCSSSGPMNVPPQGSVGNTGPSNAPYNPQHSSYPASNNPSNTTNPYQRQQPPYPANNNRIYAQQQQQQPTYPSRNHMSNPDQPQQPTYTPGSQSPQQPGYTSTAGAPPTGTHVPANQSPQQSGYAPSPGSPPGSNAATYTPGNQSPQQPGSATSGAPPPPRTSAAAEVIDKYLGPSTLKLEKRDDKAPPPPPPPRRNYGPQGTQEKKSGKDLVAESAACAVIEKYLGPWPGFPPRDPKIDEYLDSLPENAACAAIDKYFGPYKPLFVFKKNEENANNPSPPSRPPRNRMMSRARNRAWNSSQQGASVDRPWTAPQQGSAADATQGGQSPQSSGVPPPQQGAAATSSTQGSGAMPSQQSAPSGIPPQQGSGARPPPHGANMAPPHGAGFVPPGSNNS